MREGFTRRSMEIQRRHVNVISCFIETEKWRLRETSLHGKLFRREIVAQVSEMCMCYVTREGR